MNYLPEKNDRFKAKLIGHESIYFFSGNILICAGWTKPYQHKDRPRIYGPGQFCLARKPGEKAWDYKLDRSIWEFERINDGDIKQDTAPKS
jgi:hypothetical protein